MLLSLYSGAVRCIVPAGPEPVMEIPDDASFVTPKQGTTASKARIRLFGEKPDSLPMRQIQVWEVRIWTDEIS